MTDRVAINSISAKVLPELLEGSVSAPSAQFVSGLDRRLAIAWDIASVPAYGNLLGSPAKSSLLVHRLPVLAGNHIGARRGAGGRPVATMLFTAVWVALPGPYPAGDCFGKTLG